MNPRKILFALALTVGCAEPDAREWRGIIRVDPLAREKPVTLCVAHRTPECSLHETLTDALRTLKSTPPQSTHEKGDDTWPQHNYTPAQKPSRAVRS